MAELLDMETFQSMKELLDDEFPVFLDTFFTQNQSALDSIKTGLVETNADSVKYAAHNLKSSAGYLGAAPLSELAMQMEEKAESGDLQIGDLHIEAQSMLDTIRAVIDEL